MNFNKFAKIIPIIDNEGYILAINKKVDNNNEYIKTNTKLYDNEIGYCKDENSLLIMYENRLISLSGDLGNNKNILISNMNNSSTNPINLNYKNVSITKIMIITNVKTYDVNTGAGKFNLIHTTSTGQRNIIFSTYLPEVVYDNFGNSTDEIPTMLSFDTNININSDQSVKLYFETPINGVNIDSNLNTGEYFNCVITYTVGGAI